MWEQKEVERRRRENINDGIGEIARLVPGGLEKMGKGTLLRRAAEHLVELTDKVTRFDTELAKRETEKAEAQVSVLMLLYISRAWVMLTSSTRMSLCMSNIVWPRSIPAQYVTRRRGEKPKTELRARNLSSKESGVSWKS